LAREYLAANAPQAGMGALPAQQRTGTE
jgi:hypothetical protein